MSRLVFAVPLLLLGTAHAMPSDLPWEPYDCKDGKAIELKYLSDGISIEVKLGEDTMMVSPVDEEKQAGFKPGVYKGEGDFTLTIAADGMSLDVTGKDVKGGPYEACKAKPEVN